MNDIIVVGMGHGGLIAAAGLAKAGKRVCILEKRSRDELGHEWEDRFDFSLLARLIGVQTEDFPDGSWRLRGDSTFVSPNKQTHIDVHFAPDKRQKIMWRKPLINMLIDHATACGAEIEYHVDVTAPIVRGDTVVGVQTEKGERLADLIIDASGVFSTLRSRLPESFGIEKAPRRGDVFYADRAYYRRVEGFATPDTPFEVYLIHEGEPGLSWFCTNEDSVDVLIGRIDPIDRTKVDQQLSIFKQSHPWLGDEVLCGGQFAVIPVRRPLALMVANGYAAVGDSAFMTTPMNGMGIDLSMQAGEILANCVNRLGTGIDALWAYNREYLTTVGAKAAKNEGLKNALLNMTSNGVDCLYANSVIEASDLAGGGENMTFGRLLRKFLNGMKTPKYFFAIIGGLIKGGKMASIYAHPPAAYERKAIDKWQRKINQNVIEVERK